MSKDFKDFKFDYEGLEVCPLCQNDVLIGHGKVNWHDFDFWYNICTKCGLKFMNPRPTQESYRDFYKNYFCAQLFFIFCETFFIFCASIENFLSF